MVKSTQEMIKMHDGVAIRVARFEPSNKPVKVIQIIHGFGEGIEHYEETAEFFVRNGYACVIHDQRGFGKMPDKTPAQKQKARGVTLGYEYFLEDIKTLREKIARWYPELPVVIFGCSMGGNITSNYLLKYPQEQYEKAILEVPWLRLYKPLSKFALMTARILGKISRKLAISSHLNLDDISRDKDKINGLKNDGIFHDRISFQLLTEILNAGEYAVSNATRIALPTLLLCAGDDKIVSSKAIREFADKANKNVTFIEYPGGYHCLHMDIIDAQVLDAMLAFIQGNIKD
jgi:alpha-beta hydrolase superfamily lysophospholipase